MRIRARLHGSLYLALQAMRGRPVGRFMRTLRAWDTLGAHERAAVRARRLAEGLAHARAYVPLYRSAEWNAALDGRDASQLEHWPMLQRGTLQRHFDDLRARPEPPGTYIRNTSGSSGTPLRIAFTNEAAAWGWACEFRANAQHGIPVVPRALLMWRQADTRLQRWIRDETLLSPSDLSPERLDEGLRFLLRARPTLLWGFPAAIVAFAQHVRERRSTTGSPLVPYIKTVGEVLTDFHRSLIAEVFGGRVIDVYGCAEMGPLAVECPHGARHVLSDYVELEIFRGGRLAAPGELGDVVLTCFVNGAMPLIRYRIGDLGRLRAEPCTCGSASPVIEEIVGRTGDTFETPDGRRQHSAVLSGVLKGMVRDAPAGTLRRVLFRQDARDRWTLLIEAGEGFTEALAAEFVARTRQQVGEDCQVTVQLVERIPPDPSGKFSYFRRATAVQPGAVSSSAAV